MKQKKTVVILAAVLVVLVAAFAAIWYFTRPETSDGGKSITATIVYADKTEKDYVINTDAKFLADALLEKKLISEAEYKAGYYTVIDGKTADYTKDGAWWCVNQYGKMAPKGMNELAISDGDEFEIVYTIG